MRHAHPAELVELVAAVGLRLSSQLRRRALPKAVCGRTIGVAYYVVLRRSGPNWDASLALEQQSGWSAHASFMDGLVEAGFVLLGGPLADERRVVLAVESASEDEVRATLAADPWAGTHLVVESIEPWTIRLDGRNTGR